MTKSGCRTHPSCASLGALTPSRFWDAEFFLGEVLRDFESVLEMIVSATLCFKNINVKSGSFIFLDYKLATGMRRVKNNRFLWTAHIRKNLIMHCSQNRR
jgi:hypothetical protein